MIAYMYPWEKDTVVSVENYEYAHSVVYVHVCARVYIHMHAHA